MGTITILSYSAALFSCVPLDLLRDFVQQVAVLMAEIGQQFPPLHTLYANLQTHKTVLMLIRFGIFTFWFRLIIMLTGT